MNKQSFIVVVSWQTRNWRRAQRAVIWCKDFGLVPLQRSLYVGTLYRNERLMLDEKLKILFCGKMDLYHSFSMCAWCAKDVIIDHDRLRTIVEKPAYEIVQIDV